MSTIGVDLADPASRGLIERIYWARFAPRIRACGRDPEDALQAVYLGFLTRNAGTHPYDPAESSLSNYGYIVIRSVVANFLDHHRRADVRLGVVGEEEDAATWTSTAAEPPEPMDLEVRLILRRVADGVPLLVACVQTVAWWEAAQVARDLARELAPVGTHKRRQPRRRRARRRRARLPSRCQLQEALDRAAVWGFPGWQVEVAQC